jgi:ankyrin repeat protein
LLLEQKKLDVNQVTKRGTALHLAVINEDKKCLEILLKNDADISTPNMEGQTSLEICKSPDIRALL